MYENPLYEQRRNLDRQAGLALEASGKKRKHESDDRSSKEKEEKTKPKKEKKEKDKKEEHAIVHKEEKCKVKKEEEVIKPKLCKKDDDLKKNQEQEKYFYSKQDEIEKYKYSKKDDKYRYSRDDEDRNIRYKNSNRDEEYRYRHHKDDNDRYSEHPKYSLRDDEDKYKHEKYSDIRSKYSKEHDEGKPQVELEKDKSLGKPDHIKSEPPLKPYELPKIFCGPSPAMRAKLRKQSMEAGKAPAATSSFGKFTWKKKENQLAKEAQKVAAEFLKEDEMATKEQAGIMEDSFAKSLAVAKEISDKLASEPLMPPPWFSRGRVQIRPNLRAPTNQVRRAAMAGKPASLNTFLNLRSPNTSMVGPVPGSLVRPPLLQTNRFPSVPVPGPLQQMSAPAVTKSEPFGPKLPPSMSKPEMCMVNTTHKQSELDPTESKPVPSKATQDLSVPEPSIESRLPPVIESRPPQVIESRPPPVIESRPPPVIESRPPPVIESRPPPIIESRPPPIIESRPPPVIESRPPPVIESRPPQVIESRPPQVTQSKPAPVVESKPAPVVESKPAPVVESKPAPVQSKLPPIVVNSAPPVSSPIQSKSVPSETKPVTVGGKPESFQAVLSKYPPAQPEMIKIVSDVAAPGVPESEQTCTVFVKPPPFISKTLEPHKPDKLRNNLAAAKAQDLFGIFYSSSSQQGPSSLLRPETCNKSLFLASQAPQPRPQPPHQSLPQSIFQTQPGDQPQAQTQDQTLGKPQNVSKPQAVLQNQSLSFTQTQTSPQTGSNICPPGPQIQTESDIQITSVWSLQPTKAETTQVVPTTQSKANPADSDQNLSLNQAPNQEPKPESQPKSASQFQVEPELEFLPHPETAVSPESKPKPSPKTRGKSTPTRKTSPAFAPTRQTRSQTRYQTRQQQQQSQSESELGDHDSTTSDSKGLDVSDPGSQPMAEPTNKKDGPAIETPETLGLTPDTTTHNLDYDFNFE